MLVKWVIKMMSKDLPAVLGFALIKNESYDRLLRHQYLYRDLLYIPDGLLKHMRNNKGQIILFPYGCLELGDIHRGNILWTRHDCGLFSCLNTTMWALTNIHESGNTCDIIDNTYSMQAFKNKPEMQTWSELFTPPDPTMVADFKKARPRRYGHFDHHDPSYTNVIKRHIGSHYFARLMNTYFSPSRSIRERANMFLSKYRITDLPTVSVCYRGTDKHTEIKPTSLDVYFRNVDEQLEIYKDAEVLIQTDQEQVREEFLNRYGSKCKYILELPASRGEIVIHKDPGMRLDRAMFAQDLIAMSLALSKSRVVITHTGNTGFFLAAQAVLNHTKVIQLR